MADGNFQLNEFAKNNDPDDVSLETANGIGYFPDEDGVKNYLDNTQEDQEVWESFYCFDAFSAECIRRNQLAITLMW